MKKTVLLSSFVVLALVMTACTTTAGTPVQSPESTATQTPVPTQQSRPLPEGWQRYEDPKFGYTIGYPSDFRVGNNDERRLEIAKKDGQPDVGTANFVFVWVFDYDVRNKTGGADPMDKETIESLLSLKHGERKALGSIGGPQEWFTYTRDADQTVAGINAYAFYNRKVWEMPPTTKEIRYIIPNGTETYVVGGYVSTAGTEPYAITEEKMREILDTLVIPAASR